MIRIVLGFIILVGSALIVNELCGWLELVPRGILRLVAMRLPADLRQTVYREEWLPELIRHLHEAEGRPITRLIIGIKYAADMGRGAGTVGRELDGVREPESETRVFIRDGDVGGATESLDVYRDTYGETYGDLPAGSLSGTAKATSAAWGP